MIPLKDLPKDLTRQQIKIYQTKLNQVIKRPAYKYFIAVWFVDTIKTNMKAKGSYNYLYNQTKRLISGFNKENRVEIKDGILINLALISIYEYKIIDRPIQNLEIPKDIFREYNQLKDISTFADVNSEIVLRTALNIFNGKSRYNYLTAEIKPEILKANILTTYGKIVYPDLINEPALKNWVKSNKKETPREIFKKRKKWKENPRYFNLDDLNETIENKLKKEGAAEALSYLNKRYNDYNHGYYVLDPGSVKVDLDLWLERKLEYLKNQLEIEKAKNNKPTNHPQDADTDNKEISKGRQGLKVVKPVRARQNRNQTKV